MPSTIVTEWKPCAVSSHLRDALPPVAERLYSCSYDFIARNNTELSVQQGETLEVMLTKELVEKLDSKQF